MKNKRWIPLVLSLILGLAFALGPLPAFAEGEAAEEMPTGEVQPQAEDDSQTADQAAEQTDANKASPESLSLPGPRIANDSLAEDQSDALLSAQSFGDGLLANHTEWTALGLFTHIMNNSKPGSAEYRDAEAAIAILRGGNGSDMQKQVAAAVNLADYQDAASLVSVMRSLDFIDSYNSYRARENSEEGTKLSTNVGTNCRMLAISIVQCDWSRSRIEHSGAHSVAENLAWGYSDPFQGWYVEEKQNYKKNPTRSNDTGHYLNIVTAGTTVTGFAVCSTGSAYGICHEQSFDTAASDEIVYSTKEFRDRWFGNYFAQQWAGGLGKTVADNYYGAHFHADSEANLTRYWGDVALDTMQAVLRADDTFNSFGGTVLVATADGYWDALAAAGLAGTLKAPVIITPTNELRDQARAELTRLQPSRILVMGGPAAVTDDVVNDLRAYTDDVSRVYGATAVETAVAIYEKGSGWGKTAVVATSSGYWDALSVGPYAYAAPAPIFLTGGDNRLTAEALSAIKSGGFERVVIVGGTAAVDGGVEAQLKGAGVATVTRLAGPTAIETSAEIAKWELGEGMGASHVAVATLDGYWDALCAAPVCGAQGSVLVLAAPGRCGAIAAARDASPAGGFAHVHVIGGKAAVPADVWAWLLDNAKAK